MSPQTSEQWFDAIAKVGASIPGIAGSGVYAAGTGGQDGVQPMIEDLAFSGLPAFVLSLGPATVTPGSWEKQRYTIDAGIWVEREPLGERYAQLIGFIDLVMDTFPAKAKPHVSIDSCLVTGFTRPRAIDWNVNKYLVLPFTFEVVRNRAAQYAAAGP